MADDVVVQHDEAAGRFAIRLEGAEAFLSYRRHGQEIDLYHTYVPEAFRGRGMAEQLCRAAFEYAKANRLTVIPSCPYIASAYLKRHPEYLPLTKGATA
ncbi:MAG: N-acetyltransferase [Candidatus Omnitrophica bacterium]|nr:N-acetyltransferase [Candidatus Omnitrophota bacterium]